MFAYRRTVNTCGIAATGKLSRTRSFTSDDLTEVPLKMTVMVIYDYVLCLDREYQYVWQSRKSKASRLVYLYIRYISLLEYVMAFVTIPPVSDTVSMHISLIQMITVAARSCAILADLITIVVTWRATRTSRKLLQDTFRQPSLQDILWTNGNVYFITLLFGNLLDLILITLSVRAITDPQTNGNWVIDFLDPMTAILNCRCLLDLYETNAWLERGGSSLSQSNIGIGSLHFTAIGGPEGDSPEDSPFLSSFSGPVLHSFPDDDDMALDTADDEPEAGPSVPAQTTALAAEVMETAAEGSGSPWTADTARGSAVAGGSGVAGGSELAV
ncbi:hypothetical protein C2E23DRAFT_729975 [Lenzites betulinus]|nr:hypothetical protein C2E23DRAFT_729975 [Lenzites betulinus]